MFQECEKVRAWRVIQKSLELEWRENASDADSRDFSVYVEMILSDRVEELKLRLYNVYDSLHKHIVIWTSTFVSITCTVSFPMDTYITFSALTGFTELVSFFVTDWGLFIWFIHDWYTFFLLCLRVHSYISVGQILHHILDKSWCKSFPYFAHDANGEIYGTNIGPNMVQKMGKYFPCEILLKIVPSILWVLHK